MAWREYYVAETTKNTNRKLNSDMLGGMTSSNVETGAKPLHSVVAVWKSIHFALP